MRFRTPAARRSARSVVAAVVLAVGASVLLHIAPFAGTPAMAAVGPEPGVSGSSVYWSVVDPSGARVGGGSFSVEVSPGGSLNNWSSYASVTDCTAPGCTGPDLDPDAGELQLRAPNNDSYRISPSVQPSGYAWRDPRTETAVKPAGAVSLGRFVVERVAVPQPVCTADTFYSVLSTGGLRQVNAATGATVDLGGWPGGLTDVNALGIGANGAETYALQRSGNDVARILRLNQAGGWQSVPASSYQTGSSTPIVAGAVSLTSGGYYFGGFHTTGSALQFRVHRFEPSTGASRLVGVVDTGLPASSAANGDMTFDGAGNLIIVGATANVVRTFTVGAAALASANGGALTATVSPARTLAGLSDVNGVALDSNGTAFLANRTTAMRFDAATWAQVGGTITTALGDSVDLAGCAMSPTLTVRASVAGRVAITDQFRLELRSGTIGLADTTTSGTDTGVQPQQIGPITVRSGLTYTIAQTMAAGTASDYGSSYECTSGGRTIASGEAPFTVVIPAAAGAGVVCTVTNAPLVTSVVVQKTVQDVAGTDARPAAGWTVTAVATTTSGTATGGGSLQTGADGTARWSIRHGSLTSLASIAIGETQQPGHRFVSGACTITPRVGAATTVALPDEAGATLQGVQPGSAVDCRFVNRALATTLTLVAAVDFGSAPATSWQLSATGPQGALAGPAGTTGTTTATAPVSPAVPYLLSQSGGPAAYTQVGAWTCEDQAGAPVPVSADGSATVALGAQVTCTVVNSTAALVLLERIVGPTTLTADRFSLTASPASLPGLASSTVVGAETVTAANTLSVRPGHEYALRSASDVLHVAGQLERYLGVPTDGAVDHDDASLWEQVDAAAITVGAGQTAIFRFTASAPTPLTLPLTGGIGADAYLFGGSAVLLLAAALLILNRMRRPKDLLMTIPDRITPQRSLASPQEGTASMASTKKSMTARVAAGLGAVALATLTVLGGALPASAAADNIQPGQLGSITVHKFAEPATGTGLASDGTVVDTTGLTALGGVEFTVEHVTGIDLTTDAGWAAAAALTPATVVEADLELVDSIETSASGVAVFDELPIGVYLVTETDPGDHSVAVETAPFLVSIPMAADNGWLYDVDVYPKNSLTSIDKSVDDSAARGLGDQVAWTIKVDVPEIASNDTLDEFRITDTLDPRLTLVEADLVLTVPGAGPGEPREQVALTYGTHFTATDTSDYVVAFTPAGRDLLAGLNSAEITIEGITTVSELGDGIIQNVASVTVNGTTFSTAPVQTSWGTLAILKHVTGDEARVLAGADFQVFATEDDAIARTNPISVAGQSTFTSLDSGIAFVPGLKAGSYWIVEMKAPVGYQLVQTPIAVTVEAGDVTETSVDVRVANALIPAYTLPITGGSGQAAFMIGGFGLLAGAVGFALLRRRKAQQDA